MKHFYQAPLVITQTTVFLETALLQGSVNSGILADTTIETAGQEVEDHSFTYTGFNTTWEF